MRATIISSIGMACMTVLGGIHMLQNGDGTIVMSIVSAIAALAGVAIGKEIQTEG